MIIFAKKKLKIMKNISFFILSFFVFVISCQKETILDDPSAHLEFSTDTVCFDTVFTTIGSVTQELKIYNRYNQTLVIEEIKLVQEYDYFRLNINGTSANNLKNIEIEAKDSLYIFIEVTVNPNLQNAPIEILDSIIFITNKNVQNVKLQAFGQDMHLLDGQYINTQIWQADKPYYIINSMLIDSLETLTIEAGAKLHFSRNSTLYVKGTLLIKGDYENEVILQGSRLEHIYTDVAGQWNGIVFLDGSQNNEIDYAIIKNAVIGLNIGFIKNNLRPSLKISNSRIEHHTYSGIYALDSKILATNCIISNCGYYLTALVNGGNYEFYHCTFSNYWNLSVRNEPSLVITNFLDATNFNGQFYSNPLEKAFFGNSIVYGTNINEIGFGKKEDIQFNYLFENVLLKADQSEISEELNNINHFKSIVYANNSSKIFVNPMKYNFNLDTIESLAKDKGNLNFINSYPTLLQLDMIKKDRTADFKPDLGALEQKEKNK